MLKTEKNRKNSLQLLKEVIEVFNSLKIKWWLEAGTCLGAIRDNGFIPHDHDIDLGIISFNDALIEKLKNEGFDISGNERLGFEFDFAIEKKIDGIVYKIDIYRFYREGEIMWHRAGNIPQRYEFSAYLFDNLKEIDFLGVKCFIPDPPEKYLSERYGNWKKVVKDWSWDRSPLCIRPLPKKEVIVYIAGVWDLFHDGHVNILREAKKLGDRLIVGVVSDKGAEQYKRRPILSEKQRLKIIKAIRWVDEAIIQETTDPSNEMIGIRPDIFVHGDDWNHLIAGNENLEKLGIQFKLLPYTHGISTSMIIERIKNL